MFLLRGTIIMDTVPQNWKDRKSVHGITDEQLYIGGEMFRIIGTKIYLTQGDTLLVCN